MEEALAAFIKTTEQLTHYSKLNDHGEPFTGYEEQFQKIREASLRYRTEKTYATQEGEKDVNRPKNRYKDILPYDYTRVPISALPNKPGSDYINANYVKGANGKEVYIASQAPMPNTVNDFWRMLRESDTKVIIMACNEYEGKKHKCMKYWANKDEQLTFHDILVTQEREEMILNDLIERRLRYEWQGKKKYIVQLHYTAWPDHGVPTELTPILSLLEVMRNRQPTDDKPIVIHCSAGCGRTGALIAIDYCHSLLKLGKIDKSFSLFEIIMEMRKQRPSFVQTREQYELVHRVVAKLFQRQIDIIKEHIYSNVGVETLPQPTGHKPSPAAKRTSKADEGLCDTVSTAHVQHQGMTKPKQERTPSQDWRPPLEQRPSQERRPNQFPGNLTMQQQARERRSQSSDSSDPGSPAPAPPPKMWMREEQSSSGNSSPSGPMSQKPPMSPKINKASSQPPSPSERPKPPESMHRESLRHSQAGRTSQNGFPSPGTNRHGKDNLTMHTGRKSEQVDVKRMTGGASGIIRSNSQSGPVPMFSEYSQPKQLEDLPYAQPYSSVDVNLNQKDPIAPTRKKNMKSPTQVQPDVPAEYSYADPFRNDKWNHQRMAQQLMHSKHTNDDSKLARASSVRKSTAKNEAYEQVGPESPRQAGSVRHNLYEDIGDTLKSSTDSGIGVYAQAQHPEITRSHSASDNLYSPVSKGNNNLYSDVARKRDSSDEETDAPPVPRKSHTLRPDKDDNFDKLSLHSVDGTLSGKKNVIRSAFKKVFKHGNEVPATAVLMSYNNSRAVYFKGRDISFGKRVGRPQGARDSK